MRTEPSVKLKKIQILDDGSRKEKAFSDHLPVMAVFDISRRNE